MTTKGKLIYGVAINDADFEITYFNKNGRRIKIDSYRCWGAMIERCYSDKLHARYPTYIGCKAAKEWHMYSCFHEWYLRQDKAEGCVLDKDILIPGNKIYGPDTCVLVSQQLNNFINENQKSRGKYKIGVSWNTSSKAYLAYCSNPFTKRSDYLGSHGTEIEAHEAWRKRKHELACQWANSIKDKRVANALMTRFAR